jgi:hypothetical protein
VMPESSDAVAVLVDVTVSMPTIDPPGPGY